MGGTRLKFRTLKQRMFSYYVGVNQRAVGVCLQLMELENTWMIRWIFWDEKTAKSLVSTYTLED